MDGGDKQEMAARISKTKSTTVTKNSKTENTAKPEKLFKAIYYFLTKQKPPPPPWYVQIRGADCSTTGGS